MLRKGDIAPDFCLPDQDGTERCLREFRGRWVVLYFYPKDNTSGCTREALEFSSLIEEFENLNSVVVGVSPDSPKSHKNFIQKHDLKITLLSDRKHEVLEKYGVWQLKKQCGRESYGVVRTTFLISPTGKIERVWENVKVDGHAESVKCEIETLHK